MKFLKWTAISKARQIAAGFLDIWLEDYFDVTGRASHDAVALVGRERPNGLLTNANR